MKIKKDEGSCQKLASAGTKSRVAARELKHQRYLDVLRGANEYHIEQTTIQSREHRLFNIRQTRVALSAIDDKRYVLEDGIRTRAHGHFSYTRYNFDLLCHWLCLLFCSFIFGIRISC